MKLMDIIKSRHSIRKYKNEQIEIEDLKKILKAGVYAPSAGGGQRSMLVGIYDKRLTSKIGRMNMLNFNRDNLAGSYVSKEQPSTIDDPSIKNGFYDAPCVVAVFAQKNFMFKEADAFCCVENMLLQATELGISSCIVSRGEETFANEEGKKLLTKWNVPSNYSCVCFVALGKIDGKEPKTRERKQGRILIVREGRVD